MRRAGNMLVMAENRRRWKPGYAQAAIELHNRAGLPLVPWQQHLLEQIEQHDVDAEFRDLTRDIQIDS